jgi:hypothetical protein
MNGAIIRTATLVPLTGLIPLGLAVLATFMRPVPVAARCSAAPTGTSR